MTIRWMWSMVITLVATTLTFAQTAEIRTDLEKGDSSSYTLARLITISQQPEGGQATTRRINHVAEVTLTVDDIDDKGVASMSLRFENLMLSLSSDGGSELLYRGNRDESTASDDTLKTLGDALVRGTLTYRISAEGDVTSVLGLKEFEDAAAKQETYDRLDILGFLTEEAMPGMLSPLYQADGATRATRTVGRGWQDVETVALPPVAAIDVTTDWKLETVAGTMAMMKGTISYELRTAPNPPEDAPSLALRDATGATQLVWDIQSNQLANRVSSQDLTTVWTLGDLVLTQKQTSRIMQMRQDN